MKLEKIKWNCSFIFLKASLSRVIQDLRMKLNNSVSLGNTKRYKWKYFFKQIEGLLSQALCTKQIIIFNKKLHVDINYQNITKYHWYLLRLIESSIKMNGGVENQCCGECLSTVKINNQNPLLFFLTWIQTPIPSTGGKYTQSST